MEPVPEKRGHMEFVGELAAGRKAELNGIDVPRGGLIYRYIIYISYGILLICLIAMFIALFSLLSQEEFFVGPLIVIAVSLASGILFLIILSISEHKLKPYLPNANSNIDAVTASIFKNDFNIHGEVILIHLLLLNANGEPFRHALYACRDGGWVYIMYGFEILRIPVSDFSQAFLINNEYIFLDTRADLVEEKNKQAGITQYFSSEAFDGTTTRYATKLVGKLTFVTDGAEWNWLVMPYSFEDVQKLFL